MRITQHHVNIVSSLPPDRWSAESWQNVSECRETVGYQFGPDWECVGCVGTQEQMDALRAQFGKNVCDPFTCPACVTKEVTEWKEQGLLEKNGLSIPEADF